MNLLKILSRRTLLIASILLVAFFIVLYFFFRHNEQEKINQFARFNSAKQTGETDAGLPMRLKIPAIDVDAAIEPVGVTSFGTMDISQSPDNVAWFSLGNRPGEDGSAVIAGHYGTLKNGEGSVFDNLHKLGKGDKLYVEDSKGVVTSFLVRESRSYDSKADASDVFSSNDEKSHLNLIACEGVWDKNSKSYPKRLVVFADKE